MLYPDYWQYILSQSEQLTCRVRCFFKSGLSLLRCVSSAQNNPNPSISWKGISALPQQPSKRISTLWWDSQIFLKGLLNRLAWPLSYTCRRIPGCYHNKRLNSPLNQMFQESIATSQTKTPQPEWASSILKVLSCFFFVFLFFFPLMGTMRFQERFCILRDSMWETLSYYELFNIYEMWYIPG